MSAISVPTSIYNAVEPIAKQYDVPDSIWETVAYDESGFNPQAVGDNGTSFGLFQLHEGGQLPASYNSNPAAVFSPSLNAQLAMPAIARGYQQSGNVDTSSLTWWEHFGGISGHPGGTPGVDQANINEAQNLLKDYGSFGSTTSGSGLTISQLASQGSSDCCNGDIGCQICLQIASAMGNPGDVCCPGVAAQGTSGIGQDISSAISSAIGSAISGLAASLKPELVKVGIFIVGLALFIIAWWVLLHPGGQ